MQERLASTRLAGGTEIAYAVAGSGPLLVHAPGRLDAPGAQLARSGAGRAVRRRTGGPAPRTAGRRRTGGPAPRAAGRPAAGSGRGR